MNSLSEWFRSTGVLPHGFCYQWRPGLLWLHAVSDALIALAYFSIPIVLIYFVRKRRDVPFGWMFVCFSIFIAACGATHAMEVWTLWVPSYWISGVVKVVTALASLPTAVFLVRVVPQALQIPSREEMRAANEELRRQGEALKKSEERFRTMAENIQEIFWMMDPATKELTYVSPAFEQICEVPIESLYARPTMYMEIIQPDDRERVVASLANLEATKRLDEEFRITCPSGTVKWLRAIGFTAKGAEGKQTFVGTAQEITSRKKAEKALRESEDLFRDLVEHSSDLVCTHTLEGRLLSVNEMPAKLLGYSREELLAKPMHELLLPNGRAEFDESMRVIQRQGFVKGLMAVLSKSGERRIWEYHNTLRTDGVSAPVVRGIAHDVTEQKRIEKELRRSEEKFSKAFLGSPYPLIISTIEDGTLIEANESFVKATGYSRAEAMGRTSFELRLWVNPADRDEIVKGIHEHGRVQGRQITFQSKGGRRIIMNYSAELIELAGRRCLLSVCEDITERKRAEERLREYEKAVEGVEEMIAVVDHEYRYLLANRAFIKMLGMQREEVVGRFIFEVLGKEPFEAEVKERLDEAFQGKGVEFEVKNWFPEIGQRDLLVTYFPLEDGDRVDRVVCVLQDITERKRAEGELRRLSGQLLRLQDEERRKIARDLHDSTGQDLAALAATLAQLHDSVPAEKRKWRKLLSNCEAIAERSLREIRTLSYVLHPPMLDEAGLEDAIRHFAEGFAERTGIAIDLSVSDSFGRLGPETELGLFRVIQESLTNIQRHSGSYSARIRLTRDARQIDLEVADAGRGIVSNGARSAPPRAVGVGIPSMEERVKQVGGKLKIESSSSGTTVRVMVPTHA